MLSEKKYNLVFFPILAIISFYTFLSFFYLIISMINEHRNDMAFWTLNSVTGVLLFLIFIFIHFKIEEKYYNHSLPKSSKTEGKKEKKNVFFMEIGTYISTFSGAALVFIVILIPPEENVLSSILIWICNLVIIVGLFLLIYGFSKTKED